MSTAVGLDIGNSKCVIAISKNGRADALLNEESKRETPPVLHFAKKHRIFGTVGAAFATTNPQSTISELKRLIGRGFDEPDIEHKLRRLPYKTSRGTGNEILVDVRYLGRDYSFTAVEMLAMLLSHLKRTAERATGSAITDCVMGVPAYFTEQNKGAYLDAARIAGWNPLGLLHDGAAIALEYASSRGVAAGAATCVVFVDIGRSDTQVTVARFEGGQTKVLARSSDRDLGGRDFDEVLFEYFAENFLQRYGIDVRSNNTKASVRLRMACEKAKTVLSANTEAHISIDCLMDGKDVEGMITREKFEELSSDLLGRIRAIFLEALRADLAPDRVEYLELVGSGSRIPAISKILADNFGRDLSRTLNGSECVARGCALLCEKLKEPHKGRNFEVAMEEFTFGGVAKDNLSKEREQEEMFAQNDLMSERAKKERNALEAYIYGIRNKLSREFESFTGEHKVEISEALEEAEKWLDADGEDASETVYAAKMEELKSLIRRIENHNNEDHAIFEDDALVQVPDAGSPTGDGEHGQIPKSNTLRELFKIEDLEKKANNAVDTVASNRGTNLNIISSDHASS